jgi:hypothetical protein
VSCYGFASTGLVRTAPADHDPGCAGFRAELAEPAMDAAAEAEPAYGVVGAPDQLGAGVEKARVKADQAVLRVETPMRISGEVASAGGGVDRVGNRPRSIGRATSASPSRPTSTFSTGVRYAPTHCTRTSPETGTTGVCGWLTPGNGSSTHLDASLASLAPVPPHW